MTISKKQNGTNLEIALEGRLDMGTAPELEKELKESLEGIEALTFDFSRLDYISSAGLRVLLFARRTLGGRSSITIKHANEIVKEVFEVTRFGDILTVE